MRKIPQIYLFIVLFLIISGCGQNTRSDKQTADTASVPASAMNVQNERNPFRNFSVRSGNTELCLRDWKRNLKLEALGKPLDTSSYILGDGADTHRGSTIKTYRYDTIVLKFFGPPEGRNIWLLEIGVKEADWETVRGIRVGNSEEELKNRYPEATNKFSGNRDLYRYTSGECEMEFTMQAGVIRHIKLTYLIP